jgi:hypothetical protein
MLREMIRQSIQFGLDLRVELAGGLTVITPGKLERCTGKWWLKGHDGKREVQLALAEIKRLQLLLL